MKYLPVLLFSFVSLSLELRAQACYDWEYAYPFPTANYLNGVSAVDAGHAWAVGDGATIIYTADGGAHWAVQCPPVSASAILEDVSFANNSTGWVVGRPANVSLILHTADGGANWTVQTDPANKPLYAVQALSASVAYAVGGTGTILKTVNGGTSWTAQTSGSTQTLYTVHFIHPDTGWVTGALGTVLKTTDGGANWISQNTGSTTQYDAAFFLNNLEGWVAGSDGTIRKTTDGGASWTQTVDLGTSGAKDIYFESATVGYVAYTQTIRRTTNGGTTWTTVGTSTVSNFSSLSYGTSAVAWAVGGAGIILKTSSSGTSWTNQGNTQTNELVECDFVDENHGWAVGANGMLIYTTNAGDTWMVGNSGTTQSLIGVHFANATEGWICGNTGTIRHTTDGGLTWTAQTSPFNGALNAVYFQSPTTGWIVGNTGTILKTVNGGATWTAQNSGTTQTLFNMHFINADTGFVCGAGGVLLKTTDAGNNWAPITTGTTQTLKSVFFLHNNIGWIGGGGVTGLLRKTTDGGATWINQSANSIVEQIWFGNANEGWLIYGNAVRATTNGGTTWVDETDPGGFQFSDFEVAGQTAWIVGRSNPGTSVWKRAEALYFAPNETRVVSVDYPKKAFAAGTQPVQVTIFNNGATTLNTVQIEWEINGVAQPPFPWTGALLVGSTLDSVTIGSAFFEINTPYTIRAWTTQPNGLPDANMSNDTASVNNLYAALGGNYTLGGANPDFPTFTSAVNALALGGVVDSVFFNIRNGTYTEQITLKEVFGAGADKRITFQSESGDSTAAKLTFNSTASANYTLRLDSADWFRFRRMTLEATNGTNGRVVYLLNKAENNRFENCVLQSVLTGGNATDVVYALSSANNNTGFVQNRFEGGQIGISINSGSTTNLLIQDNTFNNQKYALYLASVVNPIISGNTIVDTSVNATSGIFIINCSNSFLIVKNKIRRRVGYGISIENSDSPLGSEGLIANNFVSIGEGFATPVYGIYLNGSDRVRVYHNTVNTRSSSTASRALYNTTSTGLDARNNIFACPLGAMPVQMTSSTSVTSNYNDFYTTGGLIGSWQGVSKATLADWQLASSQDANSRSINPQFVSNTDLHIEEPSLNNAGAPVSGVLDDIDGEPRNLVTPDIGADEFAPVTVHDVGVEVLVEPNKITPFPPGLRAVKAVLKNNGIDTVMTMTVEWQVNNVPKTPYNWAGVLYPGARDTVVIGTQSIAVGTAYNLIAYTRNPDGFPDNNPANDTAKLNDLYAALTGAYTIGGVVPNFASFAAAVTALNKGGVLGPVLFNVRNGTYNEALTITNINGSSLANTVTFQSESGDSSLVVLTRQSGAAAVNLDKTGNLIFQKMTFRRQSSDFFYLINGVTNVSFRNNLFVETTTSSSDYIDGTGSVAADSDIKILNNRFVGGYRAIALFGNNSVNLENGTRIEGNVFSETRNLGIYLRYQNAPIVRGNRISTSLAAYGILCETCNNSMRITENEVHIGQNNRGIRLYVCNGTASSRALVANNIVSIGGTSFVAGIASHAGSYQDIYHNSVNITNTNTSSRALELTGGGTNKNILNNIFANSGGGYAGYNETGNTVTPASDFNDVYTTGTNLAYWNGTNATDIQALRNLSGREQNSVSANPLFYSNIDLHVLQAALDSAATAVPEVTTDIDGQLRKANFPDIGADEFDYRTADVGITGLLQPRDTCELGAAAAVKVVIQNFGGLPQTGFDVAYRRNNSAAVVENIGARTVQPGDTIHYTFAQTTNMSAYQAHTFTLYTALAGDLYRPNDTLVSVVTNSQTPVPVTNMLPADGATGVNPPVGLSWLPAVGATRFDIYLWKADQPKPDTPTVQDLTPISYLYQNPNLVYGATYKWQVVSKNNYCSAAGPIQQFILRQLPDLSVANVQAPAQPFSGTMISVSWTTSNTGSGATGMTPWFDYVYLSTDAVYQPGADTYLGGAGNLTALNPGQGYTQMANVTLPQGLQGNYYLIVLTDNSNKVGESNENNNTSAAFPFVINLTPPPDLKVTSIAAPTNAFSGQTINISFTVKNQGSGDVPPGNTFRDYVYLSPTPVLNLNTAIYLTNYSATPLLAGASETRNISATLPLSIFGDYYIHVYTDRNNQVFEFAFEDNNISLSDTLSIFLTPPPDLVVNQVLAPALVNNKQTVTVQWTVENQGATAAAGSWSDWLSIGKSATFHPDSVTSLGLFTNPGSIAAGASAVRTANVTIPDNIAGPYYFYVSADEGNVIFEYTNENNNTARSTGATTVLSADLVVSGVTVPAAANSGTVIPVGWTVKNEGAGSVLSGNRTDRIYLSQTPVLNIAASTLLGSLSYGGSLLSGQSVGKQTNVTLPNGVSGPYFLHVVTDAGNAVFEDQAENNNTNADTIQIALTPWPDLTPISTGVLPDTLLAVQQFSFSYTAQNIGPGPVPGGKSWVDRVYMSANPVLDGTATLLHTSNALQPLAANASYTQNTTLNVPLPGMPGWYYFYVVTDGDNQVFEYSGESNNVLQSGPVFITLPDPVDLEVMEEELSGLPDTLNSGQAVNLKWCIRNLGSSTAKFNFQIWYDGVYMSTDSIWDEYSDIFVKDFTKNGPVDSLQEYNNMQSFALPNGLSGDYFFFLVADHNERTNDEEFANNIGLVRPVSYPAGPAKPVHIKLSPSPDLEAGTFLAPASGTSGQPVQVIWTVKNNGPGLASGSWTDKVYLSGDFAIDGADAIVGIRPQQHVLAPGQQYSDTLEVFLPLSASGNYVLIFKTDANNVQFETSESNNSFFTYITVAQPAPSDLVVSAVSFAPTAVVGAPFSVSWTVKNQGANPALGVLRELVYFSADSLFDSSDIPLSAAIQRSINLTPNASAPASGTANTPGLPLGDYFIVVATDVLDNILESDEGNNLRIAATKVTVTVPELPIGVSTPDTLRNNVPLYYRIEAPGNLTGETLLLTLDGQTSGGANELYLSRGTVPTRSVHDFAFSSPNQADQSILVPALDSGSYYLLAYGATDNLSSAGKQNIALKAEIVNFQILGVLAAQGGNTGNVTVRVDGAKFSPDMTLQLTDAILGTRTATHITYINSTQVFATFNLVGAAPGVYDVVASKPSETASKPDGFTIVAGDAGTTSSGDGSSGFFCTIVNIGTDQSLSKNILHPAAVRVNRLVPITIQYGNAGNVDIPAPARFLLSLRGAPLAFSPENLGAQQQELYIAFQEVGGPPGILRPGSFSSITVYSYSSKPLLFVLRD